MFCEIETLSIQRRSPEHLERLLPSFRPTLMHVWTGVDVLSNTFRAPSVQLASLGGLIDGSRADVADGADTVPSEVVSWSNDGPAAQSAGNI